VKAILDTGAASNIISNKLMRELGLKIKKTSNIIFKMANGKKVPSLGQTQGKLGIQGIETPVTLQVIDSKEDTLLLGNEWFSQVKAKIDFEKEELKIKGKNDKEVKIPIYYTKEEVEELTEEETTEESDLDESTTEEETDEEEGSGEETNDEAEEEKEINFVEEIKWRNEEEGRKMGKILENYKEVFFRKGNEILGRTNLIEHEIVVEGRPIKQRAYGVFDPKKLEFQKQHIEALLKEGIIRKSKSPWASPVILAKKKGGKFRFCGDFRKLNGRTVKDSYPLPVIDDLLRKLGKAKYFTSFDLDRGFLQVALKEEDKYKTAIITQKGLFEYNVMPFGLTNAPGTFQRLMDEVLRETLDEFTAVYIDDIIIYSNTFEEHLQHVEEVLRRLKEAKLVIKLKKCMFIQEEIKLLGHIVGRNGIKTDPEKIEKVKNYPRPTNLRELRGAIGLFTYYRKFVPEFAKLARPLHELSKKDIRFIWGERQEEAFESLKKKLTEAPILGNPDFTKPFELTTDASIEGLGIILSQRDEENKEKVIAYGSRSLKPSERNYATTELEMLAVYWGINHFVKYLMIKPFKVLTDHSALKALQNTIKPVGRRARWIMDLQQYNFEILHRSGKSNKNADALSRAFNN
jgi:hypothetical protein